MSALPTIIYVAGPGHSGSTLLTLLLSAHSHITTIGEIKVFSPASERPLQQRMRRRCTCGIKPKSNCPFWQAFESELHQQHRLALADLDVQSTGDEMFTRHNRALLTTVRTLTRADYLVDSSKDVYRLQKLLASREFNVRPIWLQRRPHGVVYSHIKKGRSWRHHAAQYREQTVRLRNLLCGKDHLAIAYEALARRPEQTLDRVMAWLGLAREESQMDWAEQEVHVVAGNRMRHQGDSTIDFDEKWRRHLTVTQKVGITWLASPWFSGHDWLRRLRALPWP